MDDESKKHIRNLLEILASKGLTEVERQIVREAKIATAEATVETDAGEVALAISRVSSAYGAEADRRAQEALGRLKAAALRNADSDFLEVDAYNKAVKEGREAERRDVLAAIAMMEKTIREPGGETLSWRSLTVLSALEGRIADGEHVGGGA